ncbi:MAG: hypothetical protein RSC93_01970 [Erysipelotrichaceae bacterium]
MFSSLIFLDDERNQTDVTWLDYSRYNGFFLVTVRSTREVRDFVVQNITDFKNTVFSLDHDLQEFDETGEQTGYTFVRWLVEYMVDNGYNLDDLNVIVHSKNPIGKQNIEKYVENAKKFYGEL